MAGNYDPKTDYQALINEAVKNNNLQAAAQYELARNAKIADLNATGKNVYGATATNLYQPAPAQTQSAPVAPSAPAAPKVDTSALSNEYMALRNKIVNGNGSLQDVDRLQSLNIEANKMRGLGDNVVTSGVDLEYLRGLIPQPKPIAQPIAPNNYMTELINTLVNNTNALNTTSPLKTMDWATALGQAKQRLNPLYEDAVNETMKAVNKHNLVRGFYGQLPGEAIKADQLQKTYNTREAAIADLANAIINNDFNQQYSITNANRAAYNDRLSAIINAINMIMGYENQRLNATAKENSNQMNALELQYLPEQLKNKARTPDPDKYLDPYFNQN